MNIVVNGLLAHYNLTGAGKVVLLLHGWGDSASGLLGLQQELAKDYRVLAVDLPGFGASQAPAEVWDLDNYANFLSELFTKLELPQPYAVIGHSNGGALAIRALSRGTIVAQKLVLLAASGIRTRNSGRKLALKVVAKTGNAATVWLPKRHRRALRERLYGVAGSDMLVVPQLQETFKRTVRQDVQADAAKLNLPTLLLFGAEDRAVPFADGERYHRLLSDSVLRKIDGAGHFLHQDKPDEVGKAIEEFLK